MKTLYIDCFSGISGDMFIGALLDAGGDAAHLQAELKKLQISDEYELAWKHVMKNGIKALKFDVELKQEGQGHSHVHDHDHHHEHSHEHEHGHDHHDHHQHAHSHDHEHGHGHGHGHSHHHDHSRHSHSHDHEHDHDHSHSHSHDHEHDHGHSHSHDHGHHHHDHRAYKDIVQLIGKSALTDAVKQTALQIFKKIGEAEGKIHGLPLERVHFHEVGAVDSIVDIVGAAILLHQLQITTVRCAPVPVGVGKIRIDHGIYPVPAPATLEMLKGIPIEQSTIRAELTTPTGAAFAAVLAESFGPMPSFKVEAIGYGAGTKTFPDHPNVLRVVIGE
ncbi:LarC family nickel insertion protein [Paenibacillus glycanilyticus]|uniref:LarC family nickel insertion protein n=1 Tax=Paenibacillus glycanilyticus TaxID=126569 RepID=UPI003EBE6F81